MKIRLPYFPLHLFIIFCIISCTQELNENQSDFEGDSTLLGVWRTTNKDWPHWIKFDSLNNYYRWSFDEEYPSEPTAHFIVKDSLIHFVYPALQNSSGFENEEFQDSLLLEAIDLNSFKFLPMDDRIMKNYIYKRDTFERPEFADIFIYYLTENESDSLIKTNVFGIEREREINMQNFEDILYELEFSWIRSFHVNSAIIVTRDSSEYNKYDIGRYGVIYCKNDSTLVRQGIPTKEKFRSEIAQFFPFVNQ